MAGEGTLFRRGSDGRWVLKVSSGPRGKATIRARYFRHRPGRDEIGEALDELRGPVVERKTITVGDYLGRWVRDVRNIRPTTRHGYEAVVVTHLVPAIGHLRLAELSPLHVEELLTNLAPAMAPKTLRNVHAVLRRSLGQAVRAGLVSRNVASREFVDPPRVTLEEPPALSAADVRRVIGAVRGDRFEAHVLVSLGTGLRQGELLGLAWEDIDLEKARLTVRYELARVARRYERVEPKTPRSRRMVPLTSALVEVLQTHRDRLVAAGFVPTATGPVFPNRSGGPLSGSYLTHAWYGILERASVARKPWKVLRATFSSRLFAEGVPDRTIADLLGHSRVATTQRHYIATEGMSAEVIEAMGRLVG